MTSGDPTHDDVTIEVQTSSNLVNWQSVAISSNGLPYSGTGYVGGDGSGTDVKTVEIRDTVTVTNGPKRFMQVKISH